MNAQQQINLEFLARVNAFKKFFEEREYTLDETTYGHLAIREQEQIDIAVKLERQKLRIKPSPEETKSS